jgi:hypothetical protein
MKGRVSLNHKPPQTITKIKFSYSRSNSHEGEGNTNVLGLTTTLVALEGHLVHLWDESPRVTNTEIVGEVLLLEDQKGHSRFGSNLC